MRRLLLMIEGDPDLALLYRLILEPAGWTVRAATDRLTARAALVSEPPPQVVVLNAWLPDGDGLDLAAEIRSALPGIPLLVLSTVATAAVRARAAAAGAGALLSMPFEPDDLRSEVSRLARGDGLRDIA